MNRAVSLLFLLAGLCAACSDAAPGNPGDTGDDATDVQSGDQANDAGRDDLTQDTVDDGVADLADDLGAADLATDSADIEDDAGLGPDLAADAGSDGDSGLGDAADDGALSDAADTGDTGDTADTADAGPELVVLDGFVPDGETAAGIDTVTAQRSWALHIEPGEAFMAGVRLSARRTADTGTLNVRLESDNAGLPSGSIVARDASASIPAASFPSEANTDLVTAEFRIAIPVSDSPYWLVLATTAGAEDSEYIFTPYNVSSGGNLAFRDGEGAWELYAKSYDWTHEIVGYR